MLLLSAASDRIGAVPPAAPGVPAGLRVCPICLTARDRRPAGLIGAAGGTERSTAAGDRGDSRRGLDRRGQIELCGDAQRRETSSNSRRPGSSRRRLTTGFREASYPAGFDDCQAAVRWLKSHAAEYRIDPHRIGAYGNSAGGHLSLLLGLAEPDGVQAVVSDSGPIDLVQEYKSGTIRGVVERFMGGPPEGARLAEYKRASPISYLGRKTPPLLLIYGEADNQIDVRTADRFVEELGRRGNRGIELSPPGRRGPLSALAGAQRWVPAVIEFFQRAFAN